MRLSLLTVLAILISVAFLQCDTNPYKQGKILYEQNCQNCHQEDGKAVRGLIPPLAGSDYLLNSSQVACIIRHGLEGDILVNGKRYNHKMPANNKLTSTQITNIINYVNHAWGNQLPYVPHTLVMEALEECE